MTTLALINGIIICVYLFIYLKNRLKKKNRNKDMKKLKNIFNRSKKWKNTVSNGVKKMMPHLRHWYRKTGLQTSTKRWNNDKFINKKKLNDKKIESNLNC